MNKGKRVAIFCFYSEASGLTKDVEFLICSLKQVVRKLIIVVNGEINEYEKIKNLSDHLIIRENRGFDAGAYKAAIFDDVVNKMIEPCEELIFCNDTFYGPFIPFKAILDKMDDTMADFWGLNLSDNGLCTFIQSYFLLFKKKIWDSGDLKKFFESMIDEETLDFHNVLFDFERGIFSFLINRNYKYDALNLQRYHIYSAVDGSICYDKLPILKKKAFSDQFYVKEKLLNALHYIEENYDYDINLILEDICNRYSISLNYDEIKNYTIHINSEKVKVSNVKKQDLVKFVEVFGAIYIYGAGTCGKIVKESIGNKRILGFIVTDGSKKTDYFEGIKVYNFSDFSKMIDIPIIVALNEKNKKQVEKSLQNYKNIIYIN